MNETQFYQIVKKYVEEAGGYIFKIHGGPMQKGGMPDVYICLKGVHMWLIIVTGKHIQ